MDKTFKFALVGGDMREVKLAELLSSDGHEVYAFSLENAPMPERIIKKSNLSSLKERFDCVILPLPITCDNIHLNAPLSSQSHTIDELFSLFPTGQTVIAGKVSNSFFEKAGRSGIRLYDYLEREDFTTLNSIPTAEGAIEVAMHETESIISGTNCLVAGFGHIGKILAFKLRALGANVTVSARSSRDLAWISAYGYTPIKTAEIAETIPEYDIIFNTIPSLIFDADILARTKPGVFVCDLASKPGGVDFDFAREKKISTVHALSLPGKVAPRFAAEAERRTIYNILIEWGN